MDSSVEYETLQRCRTKLVSSFMQSPDEICSHLIPCNIFAESDKTFLKNSQNDDSRKAEKLVSIIERQVFNHSEVYSVIVSALRKVGLWLQRTIKVLEDTHSTLLRELRTPPLINSTPVIFNETQCPSPLDETTVNPLSSIRDQSPIHNDKSLYQAIKENPNVGEGDDFEEEILRRQTSQIQGEFAGLLVIVSDSITKSEITVKRFTYFLQEIKAVSAASTVAKKDTLLFTTEFFETMKKVCKDVHDIIFKMLKGYYSWFNFDLIEHIINAFCVEDKTVCTKLENYKRNMEEYCKNRLRFFS